jgi:tRNA A-37 threonylcarbamoyl transferase component Bud32
MKRNKHRDIVIDLKSERDARGLLFCTLGMPVWFNGSLILIAGLFHRYTDIAGSLIILAINSIFAYGFYKHTFNRIIFKEISLCLPGWPLGGILYDDVTAVTFDDNKILTITVRQGSKQSKYKINARNLNQDKTKDLWFLIAPRMRRAEISSATREKLLSGVNKADDSLIEQFIQPIRKRYDIIEEPLNADMTIDISTSKPSRQIYQYLLQFAEMARQSWIYLWVAMPALIFIFGLAKLININSERLIGYPIGFLAGKVIWLCSSPLWSNLGALGISAIVLAVLTTIYKSLRNSDLISVSESGITAGLNSTNGQLKQERFAWNEIKSIELTKRHGFLPAGGYIKIKSNKSKWTMNLPLQALRSSAKRQMLLSAITTWGVNVRVSDELRDALSVNVDESYTELWLSSIKSAPKIEQLLPLTAGHKLESRPVEIIEPLASGGQGLTYMARTGDGAKVVLKEIILPMYDARAANMVIQRFEKDAALLKSLDHPQIVRLLDSFRENHRAFLVLEHIGGKTLENLVEETGPMDEASVLKLIRQMLNILAYLHGRTPPVVHRDFTPDNLMLDHNGTVKLIDFDVALETIDSKIQSTMVGKQSYLPPEQFRGRPCNQSDVYAMGATIYFLLTGVPPQALTCSSPQSVNASVSNSLNKFVMGCTALNLTDRFKSVAEAQANLEIFAPFKFSAQGEH